MPKKRTNKPVPELWTPIPGPSSWKEGEPKKHLVDGLLRAGNILKRRKKWLDQYNDYFKQTENPLFVWDAYSLARKNKMPVPEWILEYFDGVAGRLLSSENKLSDSALCLGFVLKDGGPSPFKQYRNIHMQNTAVAYVMNALQESSELTIEEACESAVSVVKERWGVTFSAETIERWYQEA